MRLQDLLMGLLFNGLLTAFFGTIALVIFMIIEMTVETPLDLLLDKVDDEIKNNRIIVLTIVLIYTITFLIINHLGFEEYSDYKYSDEFEIVNSIVYDGGKLCINGQYIDVDNIISSNKVRDDLIIEGKRYKNIGMIGIGTDIYNCKTLILTSSTANKLGDVLSIYNDNGGYKLATQKVMDILHQNRLDGVITIGDTSKNEITLVSKQGTSSKVVDDEIVELKNEIQSYKNEIEELKKEREIKIDESDDEIALKWILKILIVIWMLGIISFIVIKRFNYKYGGVK